MTPEKLHEAIGLLPSDLVTEADRHRGQQPRRKPRIKHIAAMAACFALVLACGLFLSTLGMGGSSKGAPMEMAAAEEPASVQQTPSMAMPDSHAYEEAAPAEGIPAEAEEEFGNPVAGDSSLAPGENASSSTLCIDHAHSPATEPETREDPVEGYCGNTTATLYIDGKAHTLYGDDAIALTDILLNLAYDTESVCRCMAEYAADTETETGFEINLTEYFVRCENGQAALTEQQTEIIREIISRLK